MRPVISGFGLLFGLLTLSSCAVTSHAEESKPVRSDIWTFVDLKSGASSFLSLKDARFVIFEEAHPVSFCPSDSSFYCFSSTIVEFAVPKNRKRQTQWVLDDRVYCVIQRFPYRDNHADSAEQAWLIFSRVGKDCEGSKPYDVTAVFSETRGLRLVSRTFREGGIVELLSTDHIGFGVN